MVSHRRLGAERNVVAEGETSRKKNYQQITTDKPAALFLHRAIEERL